MICEFAPPRTPVLLLWRRSSGRMLMPSLFAVRSTVRSWGTKMLCRTNGPAGTANPIRRCIPARARVCGTVHRHSTHACARLGGSRRAEAGRVSANAPNAYTARDWVRRVGVQLLRLHGGASPPRGAGRAFSHCTSQFQFCLAGVRVFQKGGARQMYQCTGWVTTRWGPEALGTKSLYEDTDDMHGGTRTGTWAWRAPCGC